MRLLIHEANGCVCMCLSKWPKDQYQICGAGSNTLAGLRDKERQKRRKIIVEGYCKTKTCCLAHEKKKKKIQLPNF